MPAPFFPPRKVGGFQPFTPIRAAGSARHDAAMAAQAARVPRLAVLQPRPPQRTPAQFRAPINRR